MRACQTPAGFDPMASCLKAEIVDHWAEIDQQLEFTRASKALFILWGVLRLEIDMT